MPNIFCFKLLKRKSLVLAIIILTIIYSPLSHCQSLIRFIYLIFFFFLSVMAFWFLMHSCFAFLFCMLEPHSDWQLSLILRDPLHCCSVISLACPSACLHTRFGFSAELAPADESRDKIFFQSRPCETRGNNDFIRTQSGARVSEMPSLPWK